VSSVRLVVQWRVEQTPHARGGSTEGSQAPVEDQDLEIRYEDEECLGVKVPGNVAGIRNVESSLLLYGVGVMCVSSSF